MTTKTKISAARAFGSIAFARGTMCIPANDADCMGLVAGLPIGGDATNILKAWVSGWTQACLAA